VNLKISDVLSVTRHSTRVRGFIVAFGTKLTNDPGALRRVTFGPGRIDTNIFEMFVSETLGAATTPGLAVWARVPMNRVELIPVKIDALNTAGLVLAATEITVAAGATVECNGAGFVWDDTLFNDMSRRTVMVQIKADFIPDVVLGLKPRAVDGNFLLGTLPTGDRVEGGTFWSFFSVVGG
jgi:hypothetical protein